MKKILLTFVLVVMSIGAKAQFAEGTNYVNASLSGLGMSVHGGQRGFSMGLDAMGGRFVADNWMVLGRFGWDIYAANGNSNSQVQLNAGARYYFSQNGIFVGAGLQWERVAKNANYGQLVPEVGYCYYLNHYVSLEPSLYADIAFIGDNLKQGCGLGLRLGVGFYF